MSTPPKGSSFALTHAAGPDTTLLITDIENSTALWETLPQAVMTAVVRGR